MSDVIDSTWINGERFSVTYRLAADYKMAKKMAEDICLEQTVEVTRSVIPADPIGTWILGQIEQFTEITTTSYEVVISYAAEITAWELPQLLNVILGNTSLTPGVRVQQVQLSPDIQAAFRGPRFGIAGLRKLINATTRPLLATAIKPMGLTITALANKAYSMAMGGLDLIKDDHGLTNQPFGRYVDRVAQVCEAVRRANEVSGNNALYLPNVTGPADQIQARAQIAKREGAGGLLISPGLVGFDTMRALADDDALALPIMTHPTFLGAFVTNPDHGIDHSIVFGFLTRLAGADATIFTNYGGRFAFSRAECSSIAAACCQPLGNIASIFPVPAGGMTFDRIGDLHQTYGAEVIYLIGGALMAHSPDLVANCQYFRKLVAQETAQ